MKVPLGRLILASLITGLALFAGILTQAPPWNWYGFPFGFFLVAVIDLLIAGFIAGLILAGLIKQKT